MTHQEHRVLDERTKKIRKGKTFDEGAGCIGIVRDILIFLSKSADGSGAAYPEDPDEGKPGYFEPHVTDNSVCQTTFGNRNPF